MSGLEPRSSDELSAMLRESAGGLRIRGAGTWLDAGHPVRAAHELSLTQLSGVRAYVPADLTISVAAATTLAELDAVTRAKGQCCPLLPWGDDGGSVGATLATATSGPFAESLGRPRDLALGLECVDGNGRVIRAGGRVVKNVAGFDLTRLMVGAWGTLGVITEVHLRLRALPAAELSLVLGAGRADALASFLRGPYAPTAAVPLTPRLAGALKLNLDSRWLLRFGGNAAFLRAARAAVAALGPSQEVDASLWKDLRREAAPAPTAKSWRWDALSQRLKQRFDPRQQLNPGLLGEPLQ